MQGQISKIRRIILVKYKPSIFVVNRNSFNRAENRKRLGYVFYLSPIVNGIIKPADFGS